MDVWFVYDIYIYEYYLILNLAENVENATSLDEKNNVIGNTSQTVDASTQTDEEIKTNKCFIM